MFCLPGGVTSGQRLQMVLGAPMPRVGDTYILFIKGGSWVYTPFVNWYFGALREEKLGNDTVLVTSNGDCVLSASNAYLELGPHLMVEDQIRHVSSLGVNVDSVISSATPEALLSSPSGSGPGRSRFEPINQCAISSVILDSLRQRANARAATGSYSAAATRSTLEQFQTPLHVLVKRDAR